jgi:hypothetical protein
MKNNGESRLQIACVKWFKYQYPNLILFAIPNGGQRSAVTGAILKAEGSKAGVSDIMIIEPRGMYHGMFIEMKYEKGTLTLDQKEFITQAEKRNYKCVVCRSFQDFQYEVEMYLKQQKLTA